MNILPIAIVLFTLTVIGCSDASDRATPYGTPGPDYNPTPLLSDATFYNDPAHTTVPLNQCDSWGWTYDVNGNKVIGMFSVPVSKRGLVDGCSWQQCGTPGSSC